MGLPNRVMMAPLIGSTSKVLPAYAKYFFYKTMAAPPSKGLGLFNYGVNINPNDNGGNGVTIWKDASWHFVDDCYIGFKKTVNGIVLNRPRPARLIAPALAFRVVLTKSGGLPFQSLLASTLANPPTKHRQV
jgi:hypothetical protein